jgi:hypothetical protein
MKVLTSTLPPLPATPLSLTRVDNAAVIRLEKSWYAPGPLSLLKALAARPFKPISAQDVADGVVYAVSCKPSNSPDLIELRPPRA